MSTDYTAAITAIVMLVFGLTAVVTYVLNPHGSAQVS